MCGGHLPTSRFQRSCRLLPPLLRCHSCCSRRLLPRPRFFRRRPLGLHPRGKPRQLPRKLRFSFLAGPQLPPNFLQLHVVLCHHGLPLPNLFLNIFQLLGSILQLTLRHVHVSKRRGQPGTCLIQVTPRRVSLMPHVRLLGLVLRELSVGGLHGHRQRGQLAVRLGGFALGFVGLG